MEVKQPNRQAGSAIVHADFLNCVHSIRMLPSKIPNQRQDVSDDAMEDMEIVIHKQEVGSAVVL